MLLCSFSFNLAESCKGLSSSKDEEDDDADESESLS